MGWCQVKTGGSVNDTTPGLDIFEEYTSPILDEPDHGGQDCGYIRPSYEWQDATCSNIRSYICETVGEYLGLKSECL